MVKEVYGELHFPKLPKDRAYTYGSLVSSVDGRIAFPESPDSTQIAKRNIHDPLYLRFTARQIRQVKS